VAIGEYEEIVFAFYLPTVGSFTNKNAGSHTSTVWWGKGNSIFVVVCIERSASHAAGDERCLPHQQDRWQATSVRLAQELPQR
jgi:hypothetical protein